MAEGLADLGLDAAVGEGWGPWAAEVLADLGLRMDGERAERIAAATAPLNRVRQDAAVLLHDRGADVDEVVAYLQRWSLVSADRAAQQVRFLTHPLWRAYITTYVEGFDLLHRWLAARPDDQPVADRFVRLLDEPLTPEVVAGELAAV
jgi:AcrR family transcriptional regulator